MKRVMILDDDPDVRDVLKEIVDAYGFEPVVTTTAREAVSTMTRQRVDLIILDISMPEISGDQFLEFIRKKGAGTPVMVVSGHLDPEVRQKLETGGVRQIVMKPFEVAQIVDAMEAALGGR